jgi:hypothetical protein
VSGLIRRQRHARRRLPTLERRFVLVDENPEAIAVWRQRFERELSGPTA